MLIFVTKAEKRGSSWKFPEGCRDQAACRKRYAAVLKTNLGVMFLSCNSLPPPHRRCKWICIFLSIAVIGLIVPWFSSHNWTNKHPMLKKSKLLPVPAAETSLPLPTPALCPENKTEMTQTEVYSHFLNVCNQEVVPFFTFPTPLDDPKFHEGQKCVTVVANVVLGGYDDFPFGIPKAWNSNASRISYASRYGMCWFLFLDWDSNNKIVPIGISQCNNWGLPIMQYKYHKGWSMECGCYPKHDDAFEKHWSKFKAFQDADSSSLYKCRDSGVHGWQLSFESAQRESI